MVGRRYQMVEIGWCLECNAVSHFYAFCCVMWSLYDACLLCGVGWCVARCFLFRFVVLPCDVMRCNALCSNVLYCAMLSRVLLLCAVPCNVGLCYVVLCSCAALCCVFLCCVFLC